MPILKFGLLDQKPIFALYTYVLRTEYGIGVIYGTYVLIGVFTYVRTYGHTAHSRSQLQVCCFINSLLFVFSKIHYSGFSSALFLFLYLFIYIEGWRVCGRKEGKGAFSFFGIKTARQSLKRSVGRSHTPFSHQPASHQPPQLTRF